MSFFRNFRLSKNNIKEVSKFEYLAFNMLTFYYNLVPRHFFLVEILFMHLTSHYSDVRCTTRAESMNVFFNELDILTEFRSGITESIQKSQVQRFPIERKQFGQGGRYFQLWI